MIVILVPFFLAAHLREAGWPASCAEATYRFCVNSTAVSAGAGTAPADRSTRFVMSALLRCRFRGPASLLCRMTDSHAISFASSNVDPTSPAKPMPDTTEEHAEYQIAEEAFEISFTASGVGRIIVNRTVNPADLNIIRALANQLNIGANLAKRRRSDFHHMEKSIIGKCDTDYHIVKNFSAAEANTVRRGANYINCSPCRAASEALASGGGGGGSGEDEYKLSGLESLGRRQGETMRLEKWRNVNKCSLRADYFFGSREAFLSAPFDFDARLVSSESSVHVSDTSFATYTFNELLIKRARGGELSMYEDYSLSLASIDATDGSMPRSIVDPASASVYAFQYIDDDDESAEEHRVARLRATTPRPKA